ncbi:MAG: Crp/Fnr family transcriptional regulator [Rhodocyclaceae bacterium]|jgi:CRP-like cAMP-binding protein|nr:Crp/Fnr family transcriptional regulator [Rhodocyclaceae bacterium]
MESDDLSALLTGVSLFRELDAEILQEVGRLCHVMHVQKGRRIFEMGDMPRAIYLVQSGYVKLAVASSDGGEKVIEVLAAGEDCGVAEVFGSDPYVCFAEAVGPTRVLCVKKEGIHRAIARDPRLSLRMLASVARRQRAIERDVAANHFQSGCCRVLGYLQDLAGPLVSANGDRLAELPLPKYLIAARLGLTPESLSRALRELAEAGLIEVRGRHIVVLGSLPSRPTKERRTPLRCRPASRGFEQSMSF